MTGNAKTALAFTARAGMTIRASTGLEDMDAPDRMSTVFFCRASAGDVLRLLDDAYLFNVATYVPTVEEKYIYTYAYQPNESWTVYAGDLSGDTYRRADYVFSESRYFRVCLKRADGADISDTEAARINEILAFIPTGRLGAGAEPSVAGPPAAFPRVAGAAPSSTAAPSVAISSVHGAAHTELKPFLSAACEDVARRIRERRGDASLVFALLADTHITVNGTFCDTVASLRAVHERVGFDGVIHLGDVTDGMVTAVATRRYVTKAIDALCSLGVPLYMTVGNHDANYFAGNREPFSTEEQCALYLSRIDGDAVREAGSPWYYRDFARYGLRFVFLHSFDPRETVRYGFSKHCLRWLRRTLADTPRDLHIAVFSHLTPLVALQYWTDAIRGGEELVDILETHNARRGAGKILAYINGHNHADQIYDGLSFPIVSIGCAKTECFTEYKPAGSHTPARRLGDVSQELWDALVISPAEERLDFIRFGAGADRAVLPKE